MSRLCSNIGFAELRTAGVHGLLLYCARLPLQPFARQPRCLPKLSGMEAPTLNDETIFVGQRSGLRHDARLFSDLDVKRMA
jgi:hypothetical protein